MSATPQIPGLPTIPTTALPADIRTADPADQQEYKTAMGFEQMLVGQLVTTMVGGDGMTADDSSSDSDSDDGDDTSVDTSNPLADGPYASQMQDTLSSALEGSGGLGLAQQLYQGMKGVSSS